MPRRAEAARKEGSRWGGFRRDPGGHFLQSDHNRRVRLIAIVIGVAVVVIAVTALIASRDRQPELELVGVESSTALSLASATRTAPTTEPAPASTEPQPEPAAPASTEPQPEPAPASTEPQPEPAAPASSSTVAPTSTVPVITGGAYGQTPTVELAGFAVVDGSPDVLGLHERFARLDGSSLFGTPTADDPLRIYVGGDSMSGTPGTALANLSRRNELIEVVEDTRTSSGLVADWFFDWPRHMTERVSPGDYDVIVMMMGGNDAQRFRSAPAWAVGDEAWVTAYRERMEAVMRSARSMGRLVIWIGMPPVTPSNIKVITPLVNEVAAGLANELGNVEYIDAYDMFLNEDGEFSTHLTDANGKRVRVRSGDGVHFYSVAGDWMADEVFSLIEVRLDEGASIR